VKRVFRSLILAILASATLSACSQKADSDSVSGGVKVRIPWQDEAGEYKLQLIELSGLDSLLEMGGKFARFFFAPGIADNRLTGQGPRGRFLKIGNDEFVPANEISQSMAAIYAHMQRLAALDNKLGVGWVNQWPRDIGVSVRVAGNDNLKENNAFYDGKTDSLFFVPYSAKDLPIAVNAGIIAHEHFHSLFYKLVIKSNPEIMNSQLMNQASNHDPEAFYHALGLAWPEETESPSDDKPRVTELTSSYYHLAILRGLNEGLADFWGWVYTGDEDFILQSFPMEGRRSMKEGVGAVLNQREIMSKAIAAVHLGKTQGPRKLRSYAYVIGTNYARAFKKFASLYQEETQLSAKESREKVAMMLLKILPEFSQDYAQALKSEPYEPTKIFQTFVNASNLNQTQCEYFADLTTFTTGVSYDCGFIGTSWKMKLFEAPAQ